MHGLWEGRLAWLDFMGIIPAGRLVPGWQEQKYLLLQEGVLFRDASHVDLKRCQWDC